MRARAIKDTRIQCPYCGMRTWSKDYTLFMKDHDRPDGKVCRKAQQQAYLAPPSWMPPPNRDPRKRKIVRRDSDKQTKHDGERYALEYIQGDYFMDFVREQMLTAHQHPESHWQIKTKADALRAAKNTFQDLTWDMGRDITAPRAFWEGVREALSTKSALSWLADEMLLIAGDLKRRRR